MKFIGLSILAVLLFVVAFAGLSPPTQKQEKQNAIAASSYVQPVAAVEARSVPATSSIENKMIVADTVAAILTDTNVRKNEVAARARNGSLASDVRTLNNYKPNVRVETDIGMSRLL